MALADIASARSRMIVDLAESTVEGEPSASALTVLQPPGGRPFTSAVDRLQLALSCLQVDLYVWLFRSELALALGKSDIAARRRHERVRAAQLKRRAQQDIYGRQWDRDRRREAAEDAAPADRPAHAAAREAQLLSEFAHNPYAKVRRAE